MTNNSNQEWVKFGTKWKNLYFTEKRQKQKENHRKIRKKQADFDIEFTKNKEKLSKSKNL